MMVERSIELYIYSIDITRQQEHFPQFLFHKVHLIMQRFSAGEIPPNTPF